MPEFFFIVKDSEGSTRYAVKVLAPSEEKARKIAERHALPSGNVENPFAGLRLAWDNGEMSGWTGSDQ